MGIARGLGFFLFFVVLQMESKQLCIWERSEVYTCQSSHLVYYIFCVPAKLIAFFSVRISLHYTFPIMLGYTTVSKGQRQFPKTCSVTLSAFLNIWYLYLITKIIDDKLILLSCLFIHSYIANEFPPLCSSIMCPAREPTIFSIVGNYLLFAICLLVCCFFFLFHYILWCCVSL